MDASQTPQPVKKSHRGRNAIITVVVILVALAFGVAVLGIYDIPVASSILGTNKPRDLGVKPTQEALTVFYENLPTKLETTESMRCLACNRVFEGSVPVDVHPTDTAITSFLQLHPRPEGDILRHTQVRYFEGGMEISTKVTKYVHAPVYAKVLVSRAGPTSVNLNIIDGKIGRLNVPDRYLKQATEYFSKLVNDYLAGIEGFRIDVLQYHDRTSDFQGTLPAVVGSSPGTWTEAF